MRTAWRDAAPRAIDDADEFWSDMTRCLSPLQRAAVLWRYRYGYPDEVLAAALGKTRNAIQANRKLGIKKMQTFFGVSRRRKATAA